MSIFHSLYLDRCDRGNSRKSDRIDPGQGHYLCWELCSTYHLWTISRRVEKWNPVTAITRLFLHYFHKVYIAIRVDETDYLHGHYTPLHVREMSSRPNINQLVIVGIGRGSSTNQSDFLISVHVWLSEVVDVHERKYCLVDGFNITAAVGPLFPGFVSNLIIKYRYKAPRHGSKKVRSFCVYCMKFWVVWLGPTFIFCEKRVEIGKKWIISTIEKYNGSHIRN